MRLRELAKEPPEAFEKSWACPDGLRLVVNDRPRPRKDLSGLRGNCWPVDLVGCLFPLMTGVFAVVVGFRRLILSAASKRLASASMASWNLSLNRSVPNRGRDSSRAFAPSEGRKMASRTLVLRTAVESVANAEAVVQKMESQLCGIGGYWGISFTGAD